jgi:hypothetical protein
MSAFLLLPNSANPKSAVRHFQTVVVSLVQKPHLALMCYCGLPCNVMYDNSDLRCFPKSLLVLFIPLYITNNPRPL